MRIPVPQIVWVDPVAWWAGFSRRRRMLAWDRHGFACTRCGAFQASELPALTPCETGRELIDRLYPENSGERRAWFSRCDQVANGK